MSTILGGLEPAITSITPIAGGGGLGNIGARSKQGGVREAVTLRVLAPIFTGELDDDGTLLLETIVPDLNTDRTLKIARVPGAKVGDTMVVTNLDNGERGCGYISEEGTVRTGIPADIANPANLTGFMNRFAGTEEGQAAQGNQGHCEHECPLLAEHVGLTCGVELLDYTCGDYCLGREHTSIPTHDQLAAAVDNDGTLCKALAQGGPSARRLLRAPNWSPVRKMRGPRGRGAFRKRGHLRVGSSVPAVYPPARHAFGCSGSG